MIDPRRALAYHEAGHVVACLEYGFPIHGVMIAEDGSGECGGPSVFDCTDPNDLQGSRKRMRELVVTFAAGKAAEELATGCGEDDWTGDQSTVKHILSEWCRRLTVETVERRARQLLRRRWPDVIRIGEVLRVKGRLIEEEIADLLKTA